MVGLAERRILQHGTRAEVLGSIPPDHAIFCCAYSTLTSVCWACRQRQQPQLIHRRRMLDYSIRDPLTSSISSEFYDWTNRGGSSSNNSRWKNRRTGIIAQQCHMITKMQPRNPLNMSYQHSQSNTSYSLMHLGPSLLCTYM
jgi:hypothetical protein